MDLTDLDGFELNLIGCHQDRQRERQSEEKRLPSNKLKDRSKALQMRKMFRCTEVRMELAATIESNASYNIYELTTVDPVVTHQQSSLS